MSQAGNFAMQWSSHGLRYGISVEIDESLSQGQVVIVNGSRRYLPRALARYPGMSVVEIHVDHGVLAQRLAARGRETSEQISRRLAQAVLETLLFYHPVVHWISTEVRNEREICCDRLVLELTRGEPREYARTLASLEELRRQGGPNLSAFRELVAAALQDQDAVSAEEIFAAADDDLRRPVEVFGLLHIAAACGAPELGDSGETDVFDALRPDGTTRSFTATRTMFTTEQLDAIEAASLDGAS